MKPTRRKAEPIAQPAMVAVTLAKDHKHLGEDLKPGADISVHPDTAQWLQAMGVVPLSQPATRIATQIVNPKD